MYRDSVHTNTFSKGADCAGRDKSASRPAPPTINHRPVCGLGQGVYNTSGRAKSKETPKQPTLSLLLLCPNTDQQLLQEI